MAAASLQITTIQLYGPYSYDVVQTSCSTGHLKQRESITSKAFSSHFLVNSCCCTSPCRDLQNLRRVLQFLSSHSLHSVILGVSNKTMVQKLNSVTGYNMFRPFNNKNEFQHHSIRIPSEDKSLALIQCSSRPTNSTRTGLIAQLQCCQRYNQDRTVIPSTLLQTQVQ